VIAAFLVGGGGRLTRARFAAVLTAATVVCAAVAFIAPMIGVGLPGEGFVVLSPGEILDGGDDYRIWWVRLPRVLAALLTGAALAAAGCAFQAVLRNPLAEPFTLGVSSGSSLAAVMAIRAGVGTVLGVAGVSAAAVAGAVITVIVVWRLARIGDSLPPATLILAGVTVSMFCSAASLVLQYSSDFAEASRMLRWMMGGLDATRWATLVRSAPAIAVGLLALLGLGRALNAMAAGSEAAASVGVDAGRTETLVFGAASLLVGASIAIAGPVGFVGLIVPHALRAIVGPDNRVLLPASILGGAALVAICDTITRMFTNLPVGVITALLGGPFFLVLLVRGKRSADLWRA
jgi:iron complex transport system permease protein